MRYERYVGILAEVAKAHGVPVFSRFALMRGWNASDAALLKAMLSRDGFHMSDRGYACLAGALGDAIAGAVARTASNVSISRTRKQPANATVTATRRG